MTTETLPAVPTSEGLLAAVDRGRQALAEARDDFERIAIRDQAKAAAAAAEVLERRDIQTMASVLIADAERAIAKANPPKTRNLAVPQGNTKNEVRKMRSAHAKLDDDEYAEIVAEAVAEQVPVTRKQLIEHVKRRDRAEAREKALEDAAAVAAPEDLDVAEIGRVSCADYADFLAGLSDVDLVLTDPPYEISKQSGFESGGDPAFANHRTDFGDWDRAPIDLDRLASGCWDALRTGGSVVVFYDLWKITPLADALRRAGFGMLRIVEWVKTNPMHVNPEATYLNTAREIAVSAVKGGSPTFNAVGHTGRYEHPTARNDGHLTRKPDGLFEDLISVHTRPGDLVADPFAGSGTTIRAAAALGRRWAAGDINPVYVDRMRGEADAS